MAVTRIRAPRFTAAWVVGVFLAAAAAQPQSQVITGSASVEATRAVERGMLLYFGFDYDAAIRAFEEGAQRDPAWSVPRWGIALSLGPNTNDRAMEGRMGKAYAAAQMAVMLARDEDARARDLANAVAARYTDRSVFSLANLNRSYSAAMNGVFDEHPLDDDIATLYVESRILTVAPSPHAATDAEAVKIIEGVLARSPNHVGANHYDIHLLESMSPVRALPSARRLDALRPDVGHLLHMPSHIYMRLGAYQSAVASNLRAVAADRLSQQNSGAEPALAAHTREYLAAAASMTGQGVIAREADDYLFVPLRFQRWDELLLRPKPMGGISALDWHIGRVLALIGTKRLDEADAARVEFEEYVKTLPQGTQYWFNPIDKFLLMVRQEMDARLAWARGDRQKSISHWKQAVTAQDQLTRMEAVLSWFHPMRESLRRGLVYEWPRGRGGACVLGRSSD